VKGVVAKLVHVNEPKAATALEVAAGGRLYQVGGGSTPVQQDKTGLHLLTASVSADNQMNAWTVMPTQCFGDTANHSLSNWMVLGAVLAGGRYVAVHTNF